MYEKPQKISRQVAPKPYRKMKPKSSKIDENQPTCSKNHPIDRQGRPIENRKRPALSKEQLEVAKSSRREIDSAEMLRPPVKSEVRLVQYTNFLSF